MLADRVQETSTSTGTGNLTLSGAMTGYRVFSTVFGTGAANLFFYVITMDQDWETGVGYCSAATTLVRNTVIASSNANTAVNWGAGTKFVFNAPPADRFTNWRDQTLNAPAISGYSEVINARGSITGAQTIDMTLGNVVTATITGATAFTFSNPAAVANRATSFTIILTNPGTNVTWPASVKWSQGSAPVLTAAGTDIVTFITLNGGTLWHGMLASADSK